MDYEEEILDHVRQHPGCNRQELIAATGHLHAALEADHMVWGGKLDRWYTGQVPAYYIPGTYTPPHLRPYTPPNLRESEASGAEMRELIPLAAGLHRDGTIHIYVNEDDSGLSVGLLEDGTLVVKVAGLMRVVVPGKA